MTILKKGVVLFLVIIYNISCSKKKNTADVEKEVATGDSIAIYMGPNYDHHKKYGDFNFTTEKEWDSLNAISHKAKTKPVYKIDNRYKTFGWHLYSKGSAYKSYNFSLLWGVSYFSYLVNADTGSYDTVHQWKTTALVDSAKVHNCKVFLTVSNFGSKRNASFLKNQKAQKTLADSLSSLLALRKADGINIDFEGVPAESKKEFSDFIVTLSDRLKSQNSDYIVSLALYAVDYHKVFDIKAIDKAIDFYTLMGYDYYGSFSKHAGPVSPLKSSRKWGENSIESSVDYYLNEGVAATKLIVGLPYYGDVWQTTSESIPGKTEKFISHDGYSEIKNLLYHKKYKVYFDKESATSYSIYKENDDIRQMWFDDSLSLSYKYDWIKSKGVSGVGIWALGYDHGSDELWDLLATKFGAKD